MAKIPTVTFLNKVLLAARILFNRVWFLISFGNHTADSLGTV